MRSLSNLTLMLSLILMVILQIPNGWHENLFILLQYAVWPFGHYVIIILLVLSFMLNVSKHPWSDNFSIFSHFLLGYIASIVLIFCYANPFVGINLKTSIIMGTFAFIQFLVGFFYFIKNKDRSEMFFVLSFYRIIQSTYWLIVSYPMAKTLVALGMDLRVNYTLQILQIVALCAGFTFLVFKNRKIAFLITYITHLCSSFILLNDMLSLKKYLKLANIKGDWSMLETLIIILATVLCITLITFYVYQFDNIVKNKKKRLR